MEAEPRYPPSLLAGEKEDLLPSYISVNAENVASYRDQ